MDIERFLFAKEPRDALLSKQKLLLDIQKIFFIRRAFHVETLVLDVKPAVHIFSQVVGVLGGQSFFK